MDPLTHALSGALLVRAMSPSSQLQYVDPPLRLKIAAGFAAATFPDFDIVLRLVNTLIYLNWHQGPTHSLLLLPVWAWLLALLFSYLASRNYHWKKFYIPICLGLTIHIMGDLITAYGLMLFAPFSTQRYYLPLAFVIDPWFSSIIVVGLVVSWIFPQQKIAAVFSLACLVGYVVFLWIQHSHAKTIGQEYADSQVLTQAKVNVLPQPLSPYHWKIIIKNNQAFHVAQINLMQGQSLFWKNTDTKLLSKINAAYQPLTRVNWLHMSQFGDQSNESELVREVWYHPNFAAFREFAVFPLLHQIDILEDKICIWFFDLRFQFPSLPPFFRFGMCRVSDTSGWTLQRQRDSFGWIRNLVI